MKTEPERKIIMYATTDNGEGYVTKIGEFDDIDEITIRVGTFDKDVVITFEYSSET